jgi:Mg-chelatase subunit ChlI
MPSKRFLFSAVVNQHKFKAAFLANIVNPKIGGLLVSGPKGSGKSTIVRAAAGILPDYEAVEGCPFNCPPSPPENFCTLCRNRREIKPVRRTMKLITLPLSCTEDRLIGSIDVENLLKKGEREIVPGILGLVNQNILYIDEVNLMPDHLVDDILDAAALHWNYIEREGVSVSHPSEFVLIGTMNPEEGDLRPQILDRFPLCVKIGSIMDPAERVEIVKRNLLFDNDPAGFEKIFAAEEEKIRNTIIRARALLPGVKIGDDLISCVAQSCAELKVDGQRPDIVIVKTAVTLAALAGRNEVRTDDIVLASELSLVHRTRDGGLLEPPTADEIREVLNRQRGLSKSTSSEKTSATAEITVEIPAETKPQTLKKNSTAH